MAETEVVVVGGGVVGLASAAALASILERLAAYHKELEPLGVKRGDLVDTCARIVYQTVTGAAPPVVDGPKKEKT